MSLLSQDEKINGSQIKGALGFGRGYGAARRGKMRYGASNQLAGIYQRKKTLSGVKISRMSFYRPTNPQTMPQQNWRSVFATGISGYQALTQPEKDALNREARKYRLTGCNLFLRRYLQANRA